ncbi:tumor necrosis factor receptor superfamily member 9b [Electrophorus electricus]|uniref:TNFR-Cys domain-containing protein n=1 Tax=Electrophorus electricus TaxID=8005 RepID=A0AAY5E995_ELEEL|nr:tumor necrosis factor receptor superfamily member 9b [Electrophorus electricus]
MWTVLVALLLFPQSLGFRVESGCMKWRHVSNPVSGVCCEVCHSGNRMVTECGSDPTGLCEPCANGTYVAESNAMFCSRCSACTAPQRVKTPCTSKHDTQCECVHGFLCGDPSCSFCIKECGRGEEPTDLRSCRPCPAGTFNNQPHSRCVKWMESCPEPDQRVTTPGTAFSDIVCSTEPDRRPTTPQADLSPRHSHDSVGFVLAVSVVCTCLIICVALPLLVTSVWRRGEPMKKPQDTQEVLAGQRSVSDLEHCSFCFPQEECGSISAASLISHGDDKPFELVV